MCLEDPSIANYKITYTPNPQRRHTRGRRGHEIEGFTAEQNDFDEDRIRDDRSVARAAGVARERSRREHSLAKAYALRGFSGGSFTDFHGEERMDKMKAAARRNRVAAGTEGASRAQRRFNREEGLGQSSRPTPPWRSRPVTHKPKRHGVQPPRPFDLKLALARFKRTGDLPEVTVETVRGASAEGLDGRALKRMIAAMLLKTGIEPNPGPATHGVSGNPARSRDAKQGKVLSREDRRQLKIVRPVDKKGKLPLDFAAVVAACPHAGTTVREYDVQSTVAVCKNCTSPLYRDRSCNRIYKPADGGKISDLFHPGTVPKGLPTGPITIIRPEMEVVVEPPLDAGSSSGSSRETQTVEVELLEVCVDIPAPKCHIPIYLPKPYIFVGRYALRERTTFGLGGGRTVDGLPARNLSFRTLSVKTLRQPCPITGVLLNNVRRSLDHHDPSSPHVPVVTDEPLLDGHVPHLGVIKRSLARTFLGRFFPFFRLLFCAIPDQWIVQDDRILRTTRDNRIVSNRNVVMVKENLRVVHASLKPGILVLPFFYGFLALASFCLLSSLVLLALPRNKLFAIPFLLGIVPSIISALLSRAICSFVERRTQLYYVPHIVAAVVHEFDRGTNADCARSTMRMKVRRLASLPIRDSDAVMFIAGSELVVEEVLQCQDFFMGRAASFALSYSTPTALRERFSQRELA